MIVLLKRASSTALIQFNAAAAKAFHAMMKLTDPGR